MSEEMESKFTRMSRMLVEGLQVRDHLVHELEAKNAFVSAILRVQSLRMTNVSSEVVKSGRRRAWSLKLPEDKQRKVTSL